MRELIQRVRTRQIVDLYTCADTPRVLAADVVSAVAVPPFDNSQMDGFAVDVEASAGLRTLPLTPLVPAGHDPGVLPAGHAAPIMTGGRIPAGADAVIPVEKTLAGFGEGASVTFSARVGELGSRGQFVRRTGSDTAQGSVVARRGQVLSPALLGVLASCGVRQVEVLRPLRVLVVSTGDEVVPTPRSSATAQPPAGLGDAQIHDANGPALTAALRAAGAHVIDTVHAPDDPARLVELAHGFAGSVDLVVSSGGISKGAFEVIRLAADAERERTGVAAMTFHSVAMQPGGPQGLGTLAGVPWVALPGNPVSGLVTVEMFLRPALLGMPAEVPPRVRVQARLALPGAEEPSPAGKLQVRRAHLRADGSVEFIAGPSSHLLGAYARANSLMLIPPEVTSVCDGDTVEAWVLP